jgi:N-acyl-L-homoserine lactone synthetase
VAVARTLMAFPVPSGGLVPVALASRTAAISLAPLRGGLRVARTAGDRQAAARLRALALRGGHPAGSARPVPLDLDPDDARALHLLAVDEEEAVGTMRLLRAEPGRPLPVERVFGVRVPDGVRAAELSRPALRRPGDYPTLIALLRGAYDEALAGGIDQFYLVADQSLLTLLRALGFGFRAVAGPVWAYGAWNIAACLRVNELLPGLRTHQAVHGCRIAEYFAGPFDATVPANAVCVRAS